MPKSELSVEDRLFAMESLIAAQAKQIESQAKQIGSQAKYIQHAKDIKKVQRGKATKEEKDIYNLMRERSMKKHNLDEDEFEDWIDEAY